MFRKSLIVFAILIVASVVAGIYLHARMKKAPVVRPIIATRPASQPTTHRAPKPVYPTYMEVLRKQNPALATTQPLDFPLDLPDAAHLVVHDPVYLDPIGNLWITRTDGEPTAKALAHAQDSEDHVIKDRPVYVHWLADDRGKWTAAVVVHNESGGFDLITKKDRQHLADDRPYHWETAYTYLGKIVVTTDVGVSVFEIDPKVIEHYHALADVTPASNVPLTMLDTAGVLAWSPWDRGKDGSRGVSRFVDGNWQDLPVPTWPAKPIQLMMLLDGSVLQMAKGDAPSNGEEVVAGFPDQVRLSICQLDTIQFNDTRINQLVGQLSDPDVDVRQAAFDELSRYGPALAPKLESLIDDQVPEAKTRIRQLLRGKITPALGGVTPIDNRLEVVSRSPDGTVIFFAPNGIRIPSETDEPLVIKPAWLALHPDGRMDHPMPSALIKDQKPEACTLRAIHDEWVISDDQGLRRLVGTLFQPLLLPEEKRFTDLIGIGTRHRWIFSGSGGDTLILDPLIADPTPKLPAWKIVVDKGTAGWDEANYPVVSHSEQNGNWALQENGWKALEPKDKVLTEPERPLPKSQFNPLSLDGHTQKTTRPSTGSTSKATTGVSLGPCLLTAADGTKYFNGKDELVIQEKTGETIEWPLPAEAVGSIDPVLMRTSDGLLFLFNQPGRLLRISPTSGENEPFKLQAVFTTDIPNADHPARVWLDPAGRIDFVSDENVLTVTFPAGHIPKEISQMMLNAGR